MLPVAISSFALIIEAVSLMHQLYSLCLTLSKGQGHGTAFARHAIHGVGTTDWEDSESMIDAVIDRGLADPQRLGIGGWSYGGFLTAWGIGLSKNRFRAGIVGAGIADWIHHAAVSPYPDVSVCTFTLLHFP